MCIRDRPKSEPSFLLSQLPDTLREQGLALSTDPEAYLESYLGYKMEPNEEPDADWRLDTMVGSTCCVPLINGYLNADNDFMDDLHADGAVAMCIRDSLPSAENQRWVSGRRILPAGTDRQQRRLGTAGPGRDPGV